MNGKTWKRIHLGDECAKTCCGGRRIAICFVGLSLSLLTNTWPSAVSARETSFADLNQNVQPKIVKIFGAGGIRGLEAYQSGFFISPDGHVLTAWSYVLDTDDISVVLHDGRKFSAKLVGADPRLEIAIVKIETTDQEFFDPNESHATRVGARVLAFSNLYGIAIGDEHASVLHGCISAITSLSARRGAYKTVYDGPVFVLDAMTNNAGAFGGALTDRRGRLLGVLGKELRNDRNNIWLNYAIPITELSQPIADILAGKLRLGTAESNRRKPQQPMTLELLGIVLLPEILNKTPAFVQYVHRDSPAAQVGLRPDDLILYVGNTVVQSRKEVVSELSYVDRLDPVTITVQRGQQLEELELKVDAR